MTDEPAAPAPDDPYSRVSYRKLIAWERRIERETPLLSSLLDEAPDRSVIDLGSGTGEHVAWFAERGCRAVGIDASESMVAQARDHEQRGHGRFVLGDARDAPALVAGEAPFGLALCLGNMLPHLTTDEDLGRLARAAAGVLAPRGILLIQLLNYERLLAAGIRHLPLDFRAGDDGEEIVFLRLLRPAEDGIMLFFPTTLALRPDDEAEPVRVESTRRVRLRAWTAGDVRGALERSGFEVALHGDVARAPFDPPTSKDLVVIAHRTT